MMHTTRLFIRRTLWLLPAATAAVALLTAAYATQKIDVRGDEAKYSADGRRAEFSGNVVLTFNGSVVHAGELVVEIREGGNRYTAEGAPVRATCTTCGKEPLRFAAGTIAFQDNEGQFLRIFGDIELCAGASPQCTAGKISADSIHWQKQSGDVKLIGKPANGYWTLSSGAPVHFRADKITYNNNTGDVEMSGGARLERSENEDEPINLRAEKITYNNNTGDIEMSGGARLERSENEDEPVNFHADSISYNNATGDVKLIGAARLARGENEITGDEILFNYNTGALTASGSNDGGRVRGVFGGGDDS